MQTFKAVGANCLLLASCLARLVSKCLIQSKFLNLSLCCSHCSCFIYFSLFILSLSPSFLLSLLFIELPYLTVSSDASLSVFILCVFLSVFFFSPLLFLSLSLHPGLSALLSVLIFFPLFSPICSSPLCDIARAALAHTFTCRDSRRHPLTEISWPIWLCGIALRDCAWLRIWHVWCGYICVCVCSSVK